jgi:hypothetical protein
MHCFGIENTAFTVIGYPISFDLSWVSAIRLVSLKKQLVND